MQPVTPLDADQRPAIEPGRRRAARDAGHQREPGLDRGHEQLRIGGAGNQRGKIAADESGVDGAGDEIGMAQETGQESAVAADAEQHRIVQRCRKAVQRLAASSAHER